LFLCTYYKDYDERTILEQRTSIRMCQMFCMLQA